MKTADTAGFIVAYPDGFNQTWNAGYCCLAGDERTRRRRILSRLIDERAGPPQVGTRPG